MVVSKQITKKSSKTNIKVKAKNGETKPIFKQIFFSENTKMYIHIFLYVVVIILLSVALTGNWIRLKDDNNANGYIKMLIKLDLFAIDARYEIGLKKMFSKLFDTEPKEKDSNVLLTALKDENTELADKIDNLVDQGEEGNEKDDDDDEDGEEDFFKQFEDPVLHIKQKLISFDFKEIRDEFLKFGNTFYNMEFDKYKLNFVSKNKSFSTENILDGPKISMRLIKQANTFNKPRLATDDIVFELGDDDSDEVKLKKYNNAIQYVKDGELKKVYKDMQNQIILFAMCMQIITILSIVALGAHVLIILFKGRLTKRIRASSVLTVFLPLILLLIPTIGYLYLISQGITIATDNYLLFTVATLLLALTWLLGLFRII
jgi:hypothetical protein